MDIGIITHWNVPNYGSFLQAYALREFIKSEFPDHDVKLVNYIKPIHIKVYYNLEAHEMFSHWPINPRFYIDLLKRQQNRKWHIKNRKFLEYYEHMIEHTKKYDENSIKMETFDCLIFGSDILWDYSIPFFGHDPISFGVELNAKHKISYAASFGTVKQDEMHPSYVIDGIRQFEAISVRDVNSAMIVGDITGCDGKIVIDPTLLWDYNQCPIIRKSRVETEYIVVYGTEFSKEQVSFIKEYAQSNYLKIVCLGGTRREIEWCDEYIWYDELDPFEWCSYIRDAHCVVTSAFHGLMLSLAFKKKIMFSATQFMIDKAASILDSLGLKEALIDNQDFEEQCSIKWNYQMIDERINLFRQDSAGWLKSVITEAIAR